jgi:protein SCO1/2
MRARSSLLVALLLAVSCGAQQPQEWEVRGVVRDVLLDSGQVVIEHEEIPGLMSAMTMSFDVPDRAVLERFEKGMVVSFTLRRTGRSFQVVGFEALDVDADAAGAARARLVGVRDPAPDFDLIDQDRRPLRLEDLRGKAVVLDFVFTHCSGPCPILTSSHVTLQRSLPAAARQRARFVSITLDPARDTPEVLRAYALARDADLAGWSFLTGPVEAIDAVARAYGVGKAMGGDGEVEHTVATFLIDPDGRIAKRYLGLEHDPGDQLLDLQSVL